MKMKRSLLLCLTLVVCASLAIGGTLAYLTDTESDVNVFTMGKVDIDLNEIFDENTANLHPGVEIEKRVWLTNRQDSNEAYVWYTYALPAAMDNAKALELKFANEGAGQWITADYADVVYNVPIDGEMYNVYTVLYDAVLSAGASTPESLTSVTLSNKVDYRNDKFCVIDNGEISYIDWTAKDNELNVIVNAYAIQKDGFDSLKAAYEAYQGQWGETTGVKLLTVNTAEELVAAIQAATEDTYITLTEKVTLTETLNVNSAMPAITIVGGGIDGQLQVTGNLTLRDMTITNANAPKNTTSKKSEVAIYVQGEGVITCDNVTFDIVKATGITSWWSSASTNNNAKWNNVILNNCQFNCNGNRALQIEGNATIENCRFEDPYRYAAQLTCGNEASETVVINFRNNTITQSTTSSKPTYGLQLTNDYGNENMVINGEGNVIENKDDNDALYVFETGTGLNDGEVKIDTITFNVTDGDVYKLDGDTMSKYN